MIDELKPRVKSLNVTNTPNKKENLRTCLFCKKRRGKKMMKRVWNHPYKQSKREWICKAHLTTADM